MENTLTIINPKEFGLEETKALELTSGLTTILTERETLKNAYIDVIDLELNDENLATFKELRLKIVKNRTQGIEKWHKVNKEFFLTGGRFIDAVKNKEIAENEIMESNLLEKEKHFENLEKKRLKDVHLIRVEKLIPLGYEIGTIDFSGMDENMFTAVLLGAEKQFNDKVEAEKQAELERLEALRVEAEKKEKHRLEFERLKAENDAKEKQIQAERLESNRIALELKAKADAELAEANRLAKIEADKQKAINYKLQAELKAKADAELAEKQRIEAENKAKELAENKAKKAPDKTKLNVSINNLSLELVNVLTIEATDVSRDIHAKFESFKVWAFNQINTL